MFLVQATEAVFHCERRSVYVGGLLLLTYIRMLAVPGKQILLPSYFFAFSTRERCLVVVEV